MPDVCPAPAADRIRLNTRFGEFEADERNLLAFPSGLPGFEQCRRFVLLSSVDAAPLQCLMSVDGPPASFLALEPRLVLPEYRCVLSPSDRERLRADDGDSMLWLVLLTINEQGVAFANLRAPIVINPATMTGYQVVPQDSLYPLRHPVVLGG
jgi:flagellar assembly factor FliW